MTEGDPSLISASYFRSDILKYDKALIEKIGWELENEWKISHNEKSLFPRLSSSVLEKYRDTILSISIDDYYTPLFNSETPVGNSNFGDCSITLWENQAFYIEVIFWHRMWTSIHEHGFSGAFLNLHGERFVAEYKYDEEIRIEEKLRKGILLREKNRNHESRGYQTYSGGNGRDS